jgi:glycerol-3-phosphate dehydrogenase
MIRSLAAAPRTSFEREHALAQLAEERFNVLVIGGGITGAGVALDAAARGLRVALVEARDFASGTSSRSSKLIHGGLRYLQQREFRLVYEALAERQRLLDNAPHLVTPLPFLIPLFGNKGAVTDGLARLYSIALWQYDLTGGLRIGKRHRRINRDEALAYVPTLDVERLVAGFIYWDAHADDARLSLTILRTAVVNYGAVAANYAPVASLLSAGDRVVGARLTDGTEIQAEVVVNATGVWSDQIRGMDEGPTAFGTLRPAKGIHLTFPAARLPMTAAAVLPVAGDRRSIFLVPWGEFTYAGTTDTDYSGPLDDPQCTPADVEYVLAAVNAAVTSQLTKADIVSSWAGLRPLVGSAKSQRTADLSRRHRVGRSDRGLVTVTGGKLTTYRRMAADTVDQVVDLLGRGPRRSPTRRLPLLGAAGSESLRHPGAAARLGVDEGVLEHLAGRYGTEARTVIAMTEADPELAHTLVPGLPYLRAEAVYAARYEMAWTLADVLERRTRATFLARDASEAAATAVARLIAPELGWSLERAEQEAATFRQSLRHARDAAGLTERSDLVLDAGLPAGR